VSDDDAFGRDAEGDSIPVFGSRDESAVKKLREFFGLHRSEVFFSRQLEVQNEADYFHWITNRALREERFLYGETRSLVTGGTVNLLWHRSYRFYRRSAARLIELIEKYADPNIGGVVGLHGEFMVLEGFARCEFVMRGRSTRNFRGKS
jgi:hypothetical protein